jgi:hypothetical protein
MPQTLAQHAYVWSSPPEFVYRFAKYNELVTAPVNTFGGSGGVWAWNNRATNAGNASALYLNAMLDLSGRRAMAVRRSSCSRSHRRGTTTT